MEISAAVIALLAFFATFWQAWIARDAEKRSLRAYVSSDDPGVFAVTNSAGAIVEWKLLPKWADHGSTPTRNLTFTLHCIAVRKDTGELSAETTEPTNPANQRNISPGHPVGAGICSVTAVQLAANIKSGLLNGARSTVDYSDVFGEHHHSEQCFTVEFLADPLRNTDPLRTIGPCDRNCEDEECKPIPRALPHQPPRWAWDAFMAG